MNDSVRIIEVKENVLADNDKIAGETRARLKEEKTFLLNLMSAPGSGKTSLLKRTLEKLKNEMTVGVMEADIDSAIDAETLKAAGADTLQIHTGGMCHLDADMVVQGLNDLKTTNLDLVVIENVGNLVCPAEFDTGAVKSVMILSVPEGDDKPLKYPLMFQVVDAVIINKTDVLPYFDFDMTRAERNIRMRNPKAAILPISAKTGEGIDAWIRWLRENMADWMN